MSVLKKLPEIKFSSLNISKNIFYEVKLENSHKKIIKNWIENFNSHNKSNHFMSLY